MHLIRLDPENPDAQKIDRVIGIIRDGNIVAFPTETFYGLGTDALNPKAIDRIFEIKGRDAKNPIPLIIGDPCQLVNLIDELPDPGRILIKYFWPGPLTIVFKASSVILPALTAGTGKIGIRLSSHPLASLISRKLSGPITATSANITGAPEATTARQAAERLGDRVGFIIDGGATPGGKGSTVLDISAGPPRSCGRRNSEAGYRIQTR